MHSFGADWTVASLILLLVTNSNGQSYVAQTALVVVSCGFRVSWMLHLVPPVSSHLLRGKSCSACLSHLAPCRHKLESMILGTSLSMF